MNFFREGEGDGPTNMGRDIDLLHAAESGKTGCRVYSWSAVWVTLGRAQVPEQTLVDPSVVPWIVRPTGGAAVLHGHDLTVGLAVPMRHSVRGSYRLAAEPLIAAMNAAGVPAVLAEEIGADDGDPSRIDCFAGSSQNDIVHRETRQKVCGCALRRTRQAVLLQASIPIGPPLVEPSSVIRNGVHVPPVDLDVEQFIEALHARFLEISPQDV